MTYDEYLIKSSDIILQTRETISEREVQSAIDLIAHVLKNNGCLLVCGNGGSASDAQHITGELIGRFLAERQALNAICLSANTSAITAWANDYNYNDIFARQVEAHHNNGNAVLFCLSTSGNSPNVIAAAHTARTLGVKVVSLTGNGGGGLLSLSDITLAVPSTSTPLIQQVHVCLYHYICEGIEKAFIK